MTKLKLLLASGIEKLDEYLVKYINNKPSLGIEVVDTIYYREGLNSFDNSTVDIVVISEQLPGDSEDFISTIYMLREKGIRVILLPGNKEDKETQELVRKCTPLGVYDYVFDPITIKDIIEKILNPASLKDVKIQMEDLQVDVIKQKTKKSLFKSKQKDENNISVTEKTEANKPEKQRPARKREGRLVVVLGFGNTQLDDWFLSTFSGLTDIPAKASTAEDLTKAIEKHQPDIVVLMRHGPMGGIKDAASLAKNACKEVPAVLFIAGELDEKGKEMEATVKSAGGYVLSCPQGETISGDELVYLMQTIIRELNEADTKADNEEEIDDKEDKKYKIELDHLKSSVSNLTKIFTEQKKKPSLSLKARIINSEGLSLEEEKDLPVAQIASHAKNPTAIVPGGLLAIVTPWRPALAGRLAAAAVNMFAKDGDEVAVIGASGCSTVSMWLDVSDEELIMSDWRVPGSQAPIIKDNIKVWAVDPAKRLHMKMADDLLMLIKEARKTAVYTVVDYADDFELAQKAAFQGNAVVLVIVPWSDPAERKTTLLWLNQLMEGKQNIVPGIDLRGEPLAKPEEFTPKVVVRNYPANAILEALKKNSDDEFVWV